MKDFFLNHKKRLADFDCGELDCNRDGREVGCRDYSGKAEEKRAPRQTNEPTSGKKNETPVPTGNEQNFLEV